MIPDNALRKLSAIAQLFTERADCLTYGYDNSRRQISPDAVIFPETHEQLVDIVKICNQNQIPLTARGKGTATTGASVPIQKGLVVSFEHMNKIISFEPQNRLIIVQPGITNQQVQDAVKASGFFWPPDPSSSAFCSIGGNLSCNSAGPRAVKYGSTRNHVLGLKAVTGAGQTLVTGAKTTKAVVGYDFTRLIIGSEGTLALISEATLKLLPIAEAKITVQVFFDSIQSAAQAIIAIMSQAITPCALEFIDEHAIDMIRDYSESYLPKKAKAMLMLEIDGDNFSLKHHANTLKNVILQSGCVDYIQAKNQHEVDKLWKTRKALSPALRKIAPKKINEDIVVPVSFISDFLTKVDELSKYYQIKIVNFGHAGNGNIHVNLLVNPDDNEEMKQAYACLEEIFKLVLSYGGTLSGEHGIGLEKKDYLHWELDSTYLKLMNNVKQQFDPEGILNPGKYGSI